MIVVTKVTYLCLWTKYQDNTIFLEVEFDLNAYLHKAFHNKVNRSFFLFFVLRTT